MFVLIWINFTDGVFTFHLRKSYIEAQDVFLFIGLMQIIDMGTGVNAQIIGTSIFWRFEFVTGIILLTLTIVLNYFLTKQLGVVGSALAGFISLTVYNGIRYVFLLRKFNMQPFTLKSLYALLLALAGFMVCHYLFKQHQGLVWIILRSAVFIIIYLTGIISLNLSPDVLPVWKSLKKRIGIGS
jgi:hypothetical protein